MKPEREKEIRDHLKAYKHFRTRLGEGEWIDGPGPDIEDLLSELDYVRAQAQQDASMIEDLIYQVSKMKKDRDQLLEELIGKDHPIPDPMDGSTWKVFGIE